MDLVTQKKTQQCEWTLAKQKKANQAVAQLRQKLRFLSNSIQRGRSLTREVTSTIFQARASLEPLKSSLGEL